MTTVTICLSPLAWKVLRRDYRYDGSAVDISGSWLYHLLTSCLRRTETRTAAECRKKPVGLVAGRIYISDYDDARYGHFVRLDRQAAISNTICAIERDNLCRLIAAMTAFGHVSRRAATLFYLDKFDYSESEINYEKIRQHYKRHYLHVEQSYIKDFQAINQHES